MEAVCPCCGQEVPGRHRWVDPNGTVWERGPNNRPIRWIARVPRHIVRLVKVMAGQ